MANELTTTSTTTPSAVTPQRLDALYSLIDNDGGYGPDTLPRALTPADRNGLQEYRKALHARLRPISEAQAERDRAQSALTVFIGSYGNVRDPATTARACITHLMDQPLFAIMAAIDDFRNGRVFDTNKDGDRIPFTLDHAPSGPRILDQSKKCAAATFGERYKCERLLRITKTAPAPISDAERERVGKLMRELAARMSIGVESDRQRSLEQTRGEADAARARAERIVNDARERNAAANRASQDAAAAEAHAG